MPSLALPRRLLVVVASFFAILGAAPAALACTGVVYPRVRYWCDVVHPATAYTNNVLSLKHYNEMYEGGTLPIGIYIKDSAGNTIASGTVNGTGYVYKTFPDATSRAYCWNRSTTITSSARCDYIDS
jgi:hypothetical protein